MARTFDDEDNKPEGSRGANPEQYSGASGGNPTASARSPGTPDEEGRHLYLDFVRTEMSRNGLTDSCMENPDEGISPEKLLEWIRAGRELRHLADTFSRSRERESVRNKASQIAVESLDADNFIHLLEELFRGGAITRERIVVLFFFCADIAIQAFRQGLHSTFHRLLEWSLRYISSNVARWVREHGGWGVVLRSGLDIFYQVSACCAMVAVVAACVVYIRRNL